MQVKAAFPHILEREYPVVKPEYPLLTVLYLLRMKDVAAVPLAPARDGESRAVFGFSSLAKLLTLGPGKFAPFLKEPCGNASDILGSVRADQDLGALLDVFAAKRLGFAMVLGPGRDGRRSLATLDDVLNLFHAGSLRTKMQIGDVGTPVFSLPGSTSIRDALKAMFAYRRRRVFISGGRTYVSDRSIMDHVFSPMVLDELASEPGKDVLAGPIDGLEKVAPLKVGPRTTFKAAAQKLRGDRGQCLLLGAKVVTSWDLVMKPWLSGNLAVR